MRCNAGFLFLTKSQTYIAVGATAIYLVIFSLFMGLILRVILAVVLGALTGFAIGQEYKGIEGYQYALAFLKFQFEKLTSGNRGDLMMPASAFNTQSSVESEEDPYTLVEIQSQLPTNLE